MGPGAGIGICWLRRARSKRAGEGKETGGWKRAVVWSGSCGTHSDGTRTVILRDGDAAAAVVEFHLGVGPAWDLDGLRYRAVITLRVRVIALIFETWSCFWIMNRAIERACIFKIWSCF